MTSKVVNSVSYEFESALSAAIPAIAQITQQYQVSGAFKTKLKILPEWEGIRAGRCTIRDGVRHCTTSVDYPNTIEIFPELLTLELDPERAEQFWTEIELILTPIMALLGASTQNTGESFEVHFFIDTATLNSEQPVVCQWDSDISQVNVLQCSKP